MLKRTVVAPARVAGVAFVSGGWLLQRGVGGEDSVFQRERIFDEVLQFVESRYVEPHTSQDLYQKAVEGMLKELGIPATIVIVRTGMRGDFETEPASLAPFDHAIAYVPSMDLYLDGTAEWTGSTELPAMDRGALALQINEGKPKLVHLPEPPPSDSLTSKRIEASIALDGSAQLDWRVDVTGSSAASWRQRYHAKATQKPGSIGAGNSS
jgi:hypothetical protein